jgi:MFS superfamily sulfate permease-like transporter
MSFVIARRLPRSPGPLIAMILAGGCMALFDLASNGIQTVGAVPRGLVVPTLPSLTGVDIVSLVPTALGGCHVPGQQIGTQLSTVVRSEPRSSTSQL